MAKEKNNAPQENGAKEKQDNAPRRDDSGRKGDQGPAQFMKDKRKRTRISGKGFEAVPRENRRDRDEKEGGARRSFNPNFTPDNKPAGGDKKPFRRDDRPYSNDDKWNKSDTDSTRERSGDKPFRHDDDRNSSRRGDKRDDKRGGKPGFARDGKKPFGKKSSDKKDKPGDYGDNYPKFPAPKIDKEMRLNRYIAMSGASSRREADELIKSGQVLVNGVVVTELGTKINPGDEVRLNDRVLRGEKKVYVIMNKPKGYVTTLEDPHADKTVMDLLNNSVKERIYPVGRLDKNSLGLLLITNDGDLTTKLTHPSYVKKKVYQVLLDKPLTRAHMDQIAQGITLEDGEIHADEISYVTENKREVGVEIHSGRNRIVRRMFEHLGYKVMKLDRVYFAGLTKKNLKRGAWRFLTPREVETLMSGKYE